MTFLRELLSVDKIIKQRMLYIVLDHKGDIVIVCLYVKTSGVSEHLRHPDSDAPAGGAHPDLASEGIGQGNTH